MKKYFQSKKEKKFLIKTIIFVLAASIMMGHGARMIYQGVFKPNTYYQPGKFDMFFDWLTLLTLGIVILYFTITKFYKKILEKNEIKITTN